jgi:anthranilate synthase/aminodeoxychorismate synthase-like glutamine amidotransferase
LILLIDNYDSFVFNLARYFDRLGQPTRVVRNDATSVDEVRRLRPQALVLSPGPCAPQQAGCSLDLVRRLHRELPILGVCLGHQAIVASLGGQVVRSPEPMHGRTSLIDHHDRGIFAGLSNPLRACRYHSLVAEEATMPACLEVTARTADGLVMAIEHRELPVVGVQFHPESILTDSGYGLLANFLRLAGASVPAEIPRIDGERAEPPLPARPLPQVPVTF